MYVYNTTLHPLMCVCVCLKPTCISLHHFQSHIFSRKSLCVYVCVCVWEREREKERECVCSLATYGYFSSVFFNFFAIFTKSISFFTGTVTGHTAWHTQTTNTLYMYFTYEEEGELIEVMSLMPRILPIIQPFTGHDSTFYGPQFWGISMATTHTDRHSTNNSFPAVREVPRQL